MVKHARQYQYLKENRKNKKKKDFASFRLCGEMKQVLTKFLSFFGIVLDFIY